MGLLVFGWGDVLLELVCCLFFFEYLGLSLCCLFFLWLWARPVVRACFRCVLLAILKFFCVVCVMVLCVCRLRGWYCDFDFESSSISFVVV